MALSEQNIEQLRARIIEILVKDSVLCEFWSAMPECNVFQHENSDFFKHVQVTVFLKEMLVTGLNVAAVVKRLALLVRPHIESVDEVRALAGWIGAGDSPERYCRVLRFSILKEEMANSLLESLFRHFGEEYFNEEGISFLRYCPLQ